MNTYKNQKPLAPIFGVVFLIIGTLALAISAFYTISYFSGKTREHHGTPVFMFISLIITSAGMIMLFAKQIITTNSEQITKTLKIFGIKIIHIKSNYSEIHRIETAKQTDIRIINNNQKTIILDSLQPHQFEAITETLTKYTNTPS